MRFTDVDSKYVTDVDFQLLLLIILFITKQNHFPKYIKNNIMEGMH
jgi:hypothetical protein